ncbi:MAG: substrate-binding domain-containing protein [Desulfobacterales bacterium]
MKGKKVLFTVFCILLCVSIGTVVGAAEKKVIGFIPMTMNNEYFVTMVNAAKIEAEKQGVDLLVQAGERHGSADEQLRIIEDMIIREVDAICVVPSSSTGLISAIKKAQKAGIPVVNLDTRIDPAAVKEAGLKPVPYIGTNNYDGAKMGGQYALDNLKIDGLEVAILTGISGQQNAADRRNGFVDATKGKVKVVAEQTANWEVEQGFNVFQNILQANPNIGFVFASNDNMGLGAIRACKAAGRKDIKVLGYDAVSGALQSVKEGEMVGTVAQFPAEMGIQGVQAALKMISGEKVPEVIFTKTEVIDSNNVVDFNKYLNQFK